MNPSRRILVLDDERIVARVVGTFLAEAGFRVTVETDALEALEAVAREPFDLIVTDFVLESMTGLEFVNQMPRRTPRTPVVLMSGSNHSGVRDATKKTGIDCFLPKPVDRSVLIRTVRTLLGLPPDDAAPPAP